MMEKHSTTEYADWLGTFVPGRCTLLPGPAHAAVAYETRGVLATSQNCLETSPLGVWMVTELSSHNSLVITRQWEENRGAFDYAFANDFFQEGITSPASSLLPGSSVELRRDRSKQRVFIIVFTHVGEGLNNTLKTIAARDKNITLEELCGMGEYVQAKQALEQRAFDVTQLGMNVLGCVKGEGTQTTVSFTNMLDKIYTVDCFDLQNVKCGQTAAFPIVTHAAGLCSLLVLTPESITTLINNGVLALPHHLGKNCAALLLTDSGHFNGDVFRQQVQTLIRTSIDLTTDQLE